VNCEECELLLAQEKVTPDVEAHLEQCAECWALAAEIAANAEALCEFRDEALATPPQTVGARRRPSRWAMAAAAAVVLGAILFGWRTADHGKQTAVPPAILKIKMLTPDPDVVIYWLVDANERGTER